MALGLGNILQTAQARPFLWPWAVSACIGLQRKLNYLYWKDEF